MIIAAYKGKSLLSIFIKFFTWSKYSHVSVLFENGNEYEAWQKGGVQIVPIFGMNHKKGTVIDLYKLKTTDEEEQKAELFALSQLGKKYDYWAILGFMIRKNIHEKKALVCSEYVFSICLSIGKVLLNNLKAYQVSPRDITTSPLLTFHKTIKL